MSIDRHFKLSLGQLTHPKYRPDIDGLRAIAVLLVVGFHAFPSWFRAGYMGVDVFFVISGYLISTIIFDNLQRENFSFTEFYFRRVKRIFPALLLVLITSFVFGWISLLADEYKQLGKHIAGGSGFVSNFLFWNENGYFDTSADTKPLLHLWSLGIEEQFYIFWPLMLWLAWRWKINLFALTFTLAVISFGLNISTVRSDALAAFYSPLTRFWELLAGSLLAYLNLAKRTPIFFADLIELKNNNFRNIQSYIGGVILILGMVVLTNKSVFPGWWALMPVGGAVLIISAGPQAHLNHGVLSNRILVWFGLISFPLYLWHWPLLSFARIIEGKELSNQIRISAILCAIFLAWLTYEFVEKKIRSNRKNMTVIILIFFMLVVGCIGFASFQRNGLEFRVKEFTKISAAAGEWQYPGKMQEFEFKGKKFLHQKSQTQSTTMFIGDSNIEQYYVRADELIKNNPTTVNNIIFSTGGGCIPIPSARIAEYKHCIGLLEKAMDLALSRDDINTIVIGGLWFNYLGKDEKDDRPRYYYEGENKYIILKQNIGYKKALNALSEYFSSLSKANKRVFLLLNMPIGKDLDPKTMAVRSLEDFPSILKIQNTGLNLDVLRDKINYINTDLKDIAKLNNVIVIDPINYLCHENICPSIDANNEPIYKDGAHLRPAFVRKNAKFIDATVMK